MVFIYAKIFKHYGRNILVVHIENEVSSDGSHSAGFNEAAELYDEMIARYLDVCEKYAADTAAAGHTKTVHRKLGLRYENASENSAAVLLSVDDGTEKYSERHIWKRIKGKWLMISRENLHAGHNI